MAQARADGVTGRSGRPAVGPRRGGGRQGRGESEGGGQRLDEQDVDERRRGAECAGDDDAAEKEQPQRDVAAPKREGETGGEEAVVEPLVGGERGGRFGEVRAGVEHRLAERQRPGEHLQSEEAEVLERDQDCQGDGEGFHGAALRSASSSAINADPRPPAKSQFTAGEKPALAPVRRPRYGGGALAVEGEGKAAARMISVLRFRWPAAGLHRRRAAWP